MTAAVAVPFRIRPMQLRHSRIGSSMWPGIKGTGSSDEAASFSYQAL